MTSELLIDRKAVIALTGAKRAAGQTAWLESHNWVFELDRKGWPQVSKAYFDAKMTGTSLPGAVRVQPRLDIFSPA